MIAQKREQLILAPVILLSDLYDLLDHASILMLYKPLGYAEFRCYTKFGRRFPSVTIANQIKMHFRKIKHQLTEVSISGPIDSDAEGNALTLADICSSDINVEEDVMLKINFEKLYRFIEEELDDRERKIIAKRYGIADKDGRVCKPLTQCEIAKELKISRSYISSQLIIRYIKPVFRLS